CESGLLAGIDMYINAAIVRDVIVIFVSHSSSVRTERPTHVYISLFINRVSAVDENKEEISLDVFMYVYWTDRRIYLTNVTKDDHVEITWEDKQRFWIPDLYIRQLREMKILTLFQEMTSIRLYRNSTLRVSMG
ncbi:hypothetical protein L9F63_013560, partial [Diploptera punctata]